MESNEKVTTSHEPLLLVKGDVSGIQEFIFNVKSKRASRSLKGRSFFIKILTEITIQYLFDTFSVPEIQRDDCLISTSGGNFFIKLPLTVNSQVLLSEAQLLLSKSLRFSGINISLNYIELVDSEYKVCLQNLNRKVREGKLRLFSGLNDSDFEIIFNPNDKNSYNLIDKNEEWVKITDKIKTSSHFVITKKTTFSFDIKLENGSIELIGYKCSFKNLPSELKNHNLNNYLERIFPVHVKGQKIGRTIEFEEIAQNNGAEKLGILKMDVDNLGTTLEKLENIEEHKIFDKELNHFFNVELLSIINVDFLNKIYTVTAGGDDSFFVGNWFDVLDLAMRIQHEFSRYDYFKKKGLTISAGYVIVNPKYPVIRFSQLAEDALHKAKYKYIKGNICIFDEVIPWKILDEIANFYEILGAGVNEKSKGVLSKARQSAIRGIDDDVITLKENWEMSYFLRDCKKVETVERIRSEIKENIRRSKNSKHILYKRAYRLILPIAARLQELKMRK